MKKTGNENKNSLPLMVVSVPFKIATVIDKLNRVIAEIEPYMDPVVEVEFVGVVGASVGDCKLGIFGAGWNKNKNDYTCTEIARIGQGQIWDFHKIWTEVFKDDPMSGEYLILRSMNCRATLWVKIRNTAKKELLKYRNMPCREFPFFGKPNCNCPPALSIHPKNSKHPLRPKDELYELSAKLEPTSQIVLNYGFSEPFEW